MIVSENSKPEIKEFQKLMQKTDKFLNNEAKNREQYFQKRTAQLLEEDVCNALKDCSKGTKFENTIQLVSGAQFPDIIAADCYGVEVKSTIKNHWTSTGSSILESTRIPNIERVFMTFGKLGNPVEFRSRPYEECLSEIAVTHYPRYKIDMNLKKGETIFDKMGISYDDLRKMDNPSEPVARYYKSKLKPGESLWWSPDVENIQEETVPITVKLFSSLDKEEKDIYRVQMVSLFPTLLGSCQSKYDNPSLWLLTQKGIISTHIRDEFSAGGQVEMKTQTGIIIKMPAIFGRIERFKEEIIRTLNFTSVQTLSENWKTKVKNDRLHQWCELCSKNYAQGNKIKYDTALSVLHKIFHFYFMQDTVRYIADYKSQKMDTSETENKTGSSQIKHCNLDFH